MLRVNVAGGTNAGTRIMRPARLPWRCPKHHYNPGYRGFCGFCDAKRPERSSA